MGWVGVGTQQENMVCYMLQKHAVHVTYMLACSRHASMLVVTAASVNYKYELRSQSYSRKLSDNRTLRLLHSNAHARALTHVRHARAVQPPCRTEGPQLTDIVRLASPVTPTRCALNHFIETFKTEGPIFPHRSIIINVAGKMRQEVMLGTLEAAVCTDTVEELRVLDDEVVDALDICEGELVLDARYIKLHKLFPASP
jgi:hypothetical protein